VAVSGYGHDEARARSLAAGFDRHLAKPVDRHTLEALLAAVR
jgi:CheY-like chemotaxis protein